MIKIYDEKLLMTRTLELEVETVPVATLKIDNSFSSESGFTLSLQPLRLVHQMAPLCFPSKNVQIALTSLGWEYKISMLSTGRCARAETLSFHNPL